MGLAITINVSVKELLETCRKELKPEIMKAVQGFKLSNKEEIGTQPGSYGGVHRLRCDYAKVKGWKITGSYPDDERMTASHLIHHSDCDGFYLPDDFENPTWIGSTSIGSSVRVLAELIEIPEAMRSHEWYSVWLPIVASVECRKVVYFH